MKIKTLTDVSLRQEPQLRKSVRGLLAPRYGSGTSDLEHELRSCDMLYAATDDRDHLKGVCLISSERVVDCAQNGGDEAVFLGLCASTEERVPGLMAKLYARVWRDVSSILDGASRTIRLTWQPGSSGVSRVIASCSKPDPSETSARTRR